MFNHDDDIYNNTTGTFGEGVCVSHSVDMYQTAGKYEIFNDHIIPPTTTPGHQTNFRINVCIDMYISIISIRFNA